MHPHACTPPLPTHTNARTHVLSPRSLELLFSLGALDAQGKLTHPVGTTLSRLPVDPMYGKVLLAATGMGCSVEAMQVGGLHAVRVQRKQCGMEDGAAQTSAFPALGAGTCL